MCKDLHSINGKLNKELTVFVAPLKVKREWRSSGTSEPGKATTTSTSSSTTAAGKRNV